MFDPLEMSFPFNKEPDGGWIRLGLSGKVVHGFGQFILQNPSEVLVYVWISLLALYGCRVGGRRRFEAEKPWVTGSSARFHRENRSMVGYRPPNQVSESREAVCRRSIFAR